MCHKSQQQTNWTKDSFLQWGSNIFCNICAIYCGIHTVFAVIMSIIAVLYKVAIKISN